MKQFVRSFFLLAIAVAVFFTGAGVTIMNYCCNMCSEQTIFAMEHRCGAEEHHGDKADDCCSSHEAACADHNDSNDKADHCSASRLSIDLDASMSRPHVATPFVWLSDASLFSVQLLPSDTVEAEYKEHIEMPPTVPPRSYLSLIRVLII